jgi:hypothetical protein
VNFEDPLHAAADGIVAFLQAQPLTSLAQADVYPGLRHDAKTSTQAKEANKRRTPRVEVFARHADAQGGHFRGNWNITVTVSVVSNYNDTTAAEHRARCQDIFSPLTSDTIADDLTQTGIVVVPVVVTLGRDTDISGKLITDTLTLELRQAFGRPHRLAPDLGGLGTPILGVPQFGEQ